MAQPNGTFNHHVMSDADQQSLRDRQPRRPYEGEFAGAYTQIESSTQANYSTQNPPTPVDFPNSVNYDRQPAPIIPGRESPEPEALFSMHRVHGADAAPVRGSSSNESCVDKLSQPHFPERQNPPTSVDFPNPVNYDRQPAPIIPGRESPEPDVLFSMHRVHGADAAPARGAHSDEPCVDEPSRPYFPASSSDSSYQPSSNDVAVLAGLRSLQVAAREAVKAAERHADALDEVHCPITALARSLLHFQLIIGSSSPTL